MDGILRNMTSVYLVRDDEVLCLFRQGSRVADQKYIGSAGGHFEKEELKYYFPEFSSYEGTCRFAGCDHVHEPECAVKAAVESGVIHKIRYENYLEMYQELKEKRKY